MLAISIHRVTTLDEERQTSEFEAANNFEGQNEQAKFDVAELRDRVSIR